MGELKFIMGLNIISKVRLNQFTFIIWTSRSSPNYDPWSAMATLTTLLETIVDTNKDYLSIRQEKGWYLTSVKSTYFP